MRARRLTAGARGAVAALMCVVALSACGGGGSDTPTPTVPPTAPPPTATAAPPPVIGDITWATSVLPGTNAPDATATSFAKADPAMYAVIHVENIPSGAVLSATWTYEAVPIAPSTSGFITSAAFQDGYVEFHLTKPADQDWPIGTYSIEVSMDGKVIANGTTAVDPRTE